MAGNEEILSAIPDEPVEFPEDVLQLPTVPVEVVASNDAPKQAAFEHTHADGRISRAENLEEVIHLCPFLGRLAREAPDQVEMILQVQSLGRAKMAEHQNGEERPLGGRLQGVLRPKAPKIEHSARLEKESEKHESASLPPIQTPHIESPSSTHIEAKVDRPTVRPVTVTQEQAKATVGKRQEQQLPLQKVSPLLVGQKLEPKERVIHRKVEAPAVVHIAKQTQHHQQPEVVTPIAHVQEIEHERRVPVIHHDPVHVDTIAKLHHREDPPIEHHGRPFEVPSSDIHPRTMNTMGEESPLQEENHESTVVLPAAAILSEVVEQVERVIDRNDGQSYRKPVPEKEGSIMASSNEYEIARGDAPLVLVNPVESAEEHPTHSFIQVSEHPREREERQILIKDVPLDIVGSDEQVILDVRQNATVMIGQPPEPVLQTPNHSLTENKPLAPESPRHEPEILPVEVSSEIAGEEGDFLEKAVDENVIITDKASPLLHQTLQDETIQQDISETASRQREVEQLEHHDIVLPRISNDEVLVERPVVVNTLTEFLEEGVIEVATMEDTTVGTPSSLEDVTEFGPEELKVASAQLAPSVGDAEGVESTVAADTSLPSVAELSVNDDVESNTSQPAIAEASIERERDEVATSPVEELEKQAAALFQELIEVAQFQTREDANGTDSERQDSNSFTVDDPSGKPNVNRFAEFVDTQPEVTEPVTMESIQDEATNRQPLGEIFVHLKTYLDETNPENRDEQVITLLKEIYEVTYQVNGSAQNKLHEAPVLTAEVTQKLLQLLEILGYEDPYETLLTFVWRYDLYYLLQAIRYLYELSQVSNRKEFLWGRLPVFVDPQADLRIADLGRIVVALLRRVVGTIEYNTVD